MNMDIYFSKSVFFSKVAGGEHVVRMGPRSDLNHLGPRKQRMEQGGNDIAEKGDFAHFTQFCTFDLFDMIPVTNNKEKPTLGSSKYRDPLTTHSIIEPLNRTLKVCTICSSSKV